MMNILVTNMKTTIWFQKLSSAIFPDCFARFYQQSYGYLCEISVIVFITHLWISNTLNKKRGFNFTKILRFLYIHIRYSGEQGYNTVINTNIIAMPIRFDINIQ